MSPELSLIIVCFAGVWIGFQFGRASANGLRTKVAQLERDNDNIHELADYYRNKVRELEESDVGRK